MDNQNKQTKCTEESLKSLMSWEGRIGRQTFIIRSLVFDCGGGLLALIPILGILIGIAAGIITIIQGIKRCHDIDQSGWWMVLYSLVPFTVLYLWVVKGSETDNQYGCPPNLDKIF